MNIIYAVLIFIVLVLAATVAVIVYIARKK
jgi:hypothetical protein